MTKCLCGCGEEVPSSYKGSKWVRGHCNYWKKGKTYEEIYGIKKAIQVKEKFKISIKGKK